MRKVLQLLSRAGFAPVGTSIGIVFGQTGWAADGDTAARFNG